MEPSVLPKNPNIPKTTTKSKPKSKKKKPVIPQFTTPIALTLQSLITLDDSVQINKSLLKLDALVSENHVTYKALEGELMNIINIYHNAFVKTGEIPMKTFIRRFLELYKGSRSMSLNPNISDLFIKINLRVKKSFQQCFDHSLKELALEFWTLVDGLNLETFLTAFEITELIQSTDVLPKIEPFIDSERKLLEISNSITILELHDYVPIPQIMYIITRLAQLNQLPLLRGLVKKIPDYQIIAVHVLTKTKNFQKAAELAKEYNLDPNNFPVLMEALLKSALKNAASTTDKWMRTEETLCASKQMLAYYVEDLIKKNQIDLAVSIALRHGLERSEYINKDTIAEIQPYITMPPEKPHQTMENLLYTKDDYEPTEELIKEKPSGTFWNLRDFGVDMSEDVIFVDDCDAEIFNQAIKEILASEEIGLDSEFRFGPTKLHTTRTALLQIATYRKIYLFDCIRISGCRKYQSFIKDLLSNPKIAKVGHTLSMDLKLLVEECSSVGKITTKNEVDVSKIYSSVFGDARCSLSHICATILKKPMSKYEQVSNWERRPLRKAQIHYAAFDAYIVLTIHNELKSIISNPALLEAIKEEKNKANTTDSITDAIDDQEDSKTISTSKEAQEAPREQEDNEDEETEDLSTEGAPDS